MSALNSRHGLKALPFLFSVLLLASCVTHLAISAAAVQESE